MKEELHPESAEVKQKTDTDKPPSMPRWVKIFGAIAIVLVVLLVVLHLTGKSPSNHNLNIHGAHQQ